MEKYYRFAGVELAVRIPEERMYAEDRTLGPFAVDAVEEPHRFEFQIADALEPPAGELLAVFPSYRVYRDGEGTVRYIGSVEQGWESAYLRASHRGKDHRVQAKASQFPDRIGAKTVLTALEAEHLVAQAGGFIFHSSYIDIGGRAVLFTAPSETGKSTQADLWKELRGAEIINGDRSAIRIVDGRAYACGVPFAGSSEYCKNRTLPLAAVVYLQQAPRTTIRRLRGAEAFRRVWEGVSVNVWDKEDMETVSGLVMDTVARVPVFCLACTPDESAVLALEDAMRE